LEDRDDLSELLLNGLPPEEREHVIHVIQQGTEAKLRRLRSEGAPDQREPEGSEGQDEEDHDGQEMADASD
jgi:hypothetical protein